MDDCNMDSDLTIENLAIRSILSAKTLYNPMRVLGSDKEKDLEDEYIDASAAFLGPNIWDKSAEFKMDYLDLDAILNGTEYDQQKSANDSNINSNEKVNGQMSDQDLPNRAQEVSGLNQGQLARHAPPSPAGSSSMSSDMLSDSEKKYYAPDCDQSQYTVDCKFSPRDLALATPPGHDHYDPSATRFPDEELKPQPIIKKSRKNFVPDKLKDDKYWARRHKNNIAARRSREARRLKENQIVLRASYLEKENTSLKEDVLRLRAENDMLKSQLKKFQS